MTRYKLLFPTLAATLLLSACSNNKFYAGMGETLEQTNFQGGGPVAVLRATHEFDTRTSCSVTHISYWFSGKPFNQRDEDHVTVLDCGLTFSF